MRLIRDCESIIEIINLNVLSKKPADEQKAYFLKTAADYYRYISEIATGIKLESSK